MAAISALRAANCSSCSCCACARSSAACFARCFSTSVRKRLLTCSFACRIADSNLSVMASSMGFAVPYLYSSMRSTKKSRIFSIRRLSPSKVNVFSENILSPRLFICIDGVSNCRYPIARPLRLNCTPTTSLRKMVFSPSVALPVITLPTVTCVSISTLVS